MYIDYCVDVALFTCFYFCTDYGRLADCMQMALIEPRLIVLHTLPSLFPSLLSPCVDGWVPGASLSQFPILRDKNEWAV